MNRTAAAHAVARNITAAGRAKGFVQNDGEFRVVARSCAAALTEISNACRRLGIAETDLITFQVRPTGTKQVLTYPITANPWLHRVDERTGAFI